MSTVRGGRSNSRSSAGSTNAVRLERVEKVETCGVLAQRTGRHVRVEEGHESFEISCQSAYIPFSLFSRGRLHATDSCLV